ncbi:MAG: hypothetical protein KF795_04835 [Labilithrix sp.]|nr:hypothetical protein [Labilithrix sp.]
MLFSRSIARLGVASMLGAVAVLTAGSASAETRCSRSSSTCAIGKAALGGTIDQKLATEIDSGWIDKGLVKIRTRFTIDPVTRGEPLLAVDMPNGAVVEASWSPAEKGMLVLRPLTEEGATGTMNVRYTLAPNLSAEIYGAQVNYDATRLLAKIPGASFNYDARASAPLAPWGFAGAKAVAPAPALDKSTIFALSFADLGIDPGTAEGSLAIQAAAKPTFEYTTKSVQLDAASVTRVDGSASIAVRDADFVDVTAIVSGDLALSGILDMRPVVTVDSAYGIPTFGLVKYSFSAVSKAFAGTTAVRFDPTQIHIPLPNVKVPAAPFSVGAARAGAELEKTVAIANTGELGAVLEIESSDPQFVVPRGAIRVDAKSAYDLAIVFRPKSDAPASATITVRSNDPDSPEQTFRVAANGASVGDEDDSDAPNGRGASAGDAVSSEGCSVGATGSGAAMSDLTALTLGLGLLLAGRRRRR